MTAKEWIDELERLRKAATPGPWHAVHDIRGDIAPFLEGATGWVFGEGFGPEGRDSYYVRPSFEDLEYIVAACNAVPRLVEMLRIAVSLIEAQNAQIARKGEKMPEGDVMQLIFTLTEPKE